MACVKNTMKVIESTLGKINPYYDMTLENLTYIINNSNDVYDSVVNAFRFGYIQGVKSANSKKVGNNNA